MVNAQDLQQNLAQLVSEITSSTDIWKLAHTLRAATPSSSSSQNQGNKDALFQSSLPGGQDPLSVLNIETNTLGALYILSARLHGPVQDLPPFSYVSEFCARFDPNEARMAPERVTVLAKGIVRYAEIIESPKSAIELLLNLILRFPPSPSELTTVHPMFLIACASQQCFSTALPLLLEHPITTVFPFPSTSANVTTDLTATDNLVYHYTAGIILAAMKRWTEAEDYFEMCISSPGSASAIQLEAAKKLLLVQLIGKGKTTSLPKYANPYIPRVLKNTPYHAFVDAYPRKPEKLFEIVEKEKGVFTNEQNLGLVMQAVDYAPRWAIKQLTATYLTLSLSDIVQAIDTKFFEETGTEGARATLLDMIESNEIKARISSSDIVTFETESPLSKYDGLTPEVDRVLREAQEQGLKLKTLEEEMERSREYLTKAIKAKDNPAWGGLPSLGAPIIPEADEVAMNASTGGSWAESDTMFS